MSKLRFVSLLAAITGMGILAPLDRAQSSIAPGTASPIAAESTSTTPDHPLVEPAYASPPEKTMLRTFPAIAAPYAGTMTAVYAWYPGRYGAKDALRMGNYTLLAFAGENLALEFIYGGPHTLFSRLHRPAVSGTDASSVPSR
jgi:hypothetical protein